MADVAAGHGGKRPQSSYCSRGLDGRRAGVLEGKARARIGLTMHAEAADCVFGVRRAHVRTLLAR